MSFDVRVDQIFAFVCGAVAIAGLAPWRSQSPGGAIDGLWQEGTRRLSAIVDLSAVAAVVLAPVARQYYRARTEYGLVRRLAEMEMNSADVRSYFVGHRLIGMFRLLDVVPVGPEQQLFPGFLVVVQKLGGAR